MVRACAVVSELFLVAVTLYVMSGVVDDSGNSSVLPPCQEVPRETIRNLAPNPSSFASRSAPEENKPNVFYYKQVSARPEL